MSRIAKYPVNVPDKVQVSVDKDGLTVKGPLGTLKQAVDRQVVVKLEGNQVTFAAADETKAANAMSGTLRATVANMVHGVKEGFSKKLNLSLGFSHPIVHALPDGIKAETPTQTEIVIKGVDRQRVGQVAAEVRAYKPPEPYKGKGVRYSDEKVVIKETKKK